jgi:hypothetical protein
MEEASKDKMESIEYHLVLKDFEYVFGEIPRFPPKRDIDFSVDLVPRVSPVFSTRYRMGTRELKELQVQLKELLNKGYIHPSVSHWEAPVFL